MPKTTPKLIIVSAPSGAGKTTLCQRLLWAFPKQLVLSISSTTRAPRGQEQYGRDYHFISKVEFERGVAQNEFAEWALVHGNYYGTSRKTVDDAFKAGKSVLLDIDVQGAESLRRAYPDRNLRVFIAPPNEGELERRLRARGTESEESIQKRLKNAREEMQRQTEFDHVIVNDSLDRAYSELEKVVREALKG